MNTGTRYLAGALLAMSSVTMTACGGSKSSNGSNGEVAPASATTAGVPATPAAAPVDTVAPKHHSKLGGALVGAAAGHMLGGHAVAGAAAGALIQHERNKHQ